MSGQPSWRYRLLVRLLSPLILLHLAVRALRDGGPDYCRQRLGLHTPDVVPRLWIHAASVGEIITVWPLVERLRAEHDLLLTTNTPTGASILRDRAHPAIRTAYCPLDFPGSTRRFLQRHNVKLAVMVETEIWPWLYSRLKHSGTSICIINARLGKRSRTGLARWFSQTYRDALAGVHVFAKSADDAQNYLDAGASANSVACAGNLKFATTGTEQPHKALLASRYFLAASTHHDEELQLAQQWLLQSDRGLLVLAPRHPERGTSLIRALASLQATLIPALDPPRQRSRGEQPGENDRLYLADTIGELNAWYAHATACFVGGSLIERGGHNVLEPARLGCPVIVGPHTFNFDDIMPEFKTANAIAIADTATDVIRFFLLAESDSDWASRLGDAGHAVANTGNGRLEAYATEIRKLLDRNDSGSRSGITDELH